MITICCRTHSFQAAAATLGGFPSQVVSKVSPDNSKSFATRTPSEDSCHFPASSIRCCESIRAQKCEPQCDTLNLQHLGIISRLVCQRRLSTCWLHSEHTLFDSCLPRPDENSQDSLHTLIYSNVYHENVFDYIYGFFSVLFCHLMGWLCSPDFLGCEQKILNRCIIQR